MTLAELKKAYVTKNALLSKALAQARSGDTGAFDLNRMTVISGDDVTAKRSALDLLVSEVNDLHDKIKEQSELNDIAGEHEARMETPNTETRAQRREREKVESKQTATTRMHALADAFMDSQEFASRAGAWLSEPGAFSLRTLFTTATAAYPDAQPDEVVPAASVPLIIASLIPSIPTSDENVSYLDQTTRTNAAATRTEGAAAAESAIAYTLRNQNVRSVDTYIPLTREIMADKPQMRSIIEQDLALMVAQKVDNLILNGDGTAPNWHGILQTPNIQTQAKGADDVFVAVAKTKAKIVITGRAMPGVVVMHPNDWLQFETARGNGGAAFKTGDSAITTYDGGFLWAHPSVVGPGSLYGMRVVQSTAIAEHTALIGDVARYARIRDREQFGVEFGTTGTQFVEREVSILGGVRMAFYVTRPTAFATVTGI